MLVAEMMAFIRLSMMLESTGDVKAWLKMTDDELLDTIKVNAPLLKVKDGAFFNMKTTDSYDMPDGVASLLIQKCQVTILTRMAVGTAQNYPIEAEGASIRKDYIFEHYMSLLRMTRDEFSRDYEEWSRGNGIKIITATKNKVDRLTNLRLNTVVPNARIFNLNVNAQTGKIEVAWDKFEASGMGAFKKYMICVTPSGTKAYDSVTQTFVDGVEPKFESYDPNLCSTRIEGLSAGSYEVTLAVVNWLGMIGISTLTVPVV